MEENEWMDGKTFTLLTISPPCLFFFKLRQFLLLPYIPWTSMGM